MTDDLAGTGDGAFSRRDLLLQGAGLGAFVLTGAAVGARADAAGAAIEATPRVSIPNGPEIYSKVLPKLPKGGQLTIALPNQLPANLDPLSNAIVSTKVAAYPAHDFLEYFDERGQRVLSLAESMRVLSQTVLEYTLQPNVRFHNGEACNAQAIKDLFDWIVKPGNAPGVSTLVAGARVEIVNARTFRFVLPAPNAAFRDALSNVPIVPISTASKQASNPVGCGPYVFKEWVRGVSLTYTKNPTYWNKGAPPAATLRLLTFAEAQSAVQSFDSRASDWVYNVPAAQMPSFRSRAQRKELQLAADLSQYYYFRPNFKFKPFDDLNVRQAVRLAVDRTAINMAAEGGNGLPVFSPVIAGHRYYSKEFIYKRDVARAKQLMARAGYARGVDGGNMLVPIVGNTQAAAQVMQANLREIGLNVNLQAVDLATYATLRFRSPSLFSFSFFVDEISTLFNNFFITGAGSNFTGFSNQRVDYILKSASKNYNEASRRKLYLEVFRELFVKQIAYLPITAIRVTNAYRSNTNGGQYGPTNGLYFRFPLASIKR
jgi:peptide/nickel transport system substrate-binding protein